MTREEQIREAANDFLCETQYMEDNVAMAFVEGVKWADETMLQKVLDWLKETTINDADGCSHPIVSFTGFNYKEEMLQSFKERFNIE